MNSTQTTVVDVHVKSLRANGYENLRDWCEDENNVYIGRGGIVFLPVPGEAGVKRRYPEKASKWHNPFTMKKYGNACYAMYEQHLDEMLEDPANLAEFQLLRGKTLGCWCKPGRCHGDAIVERLHRPEK